MHPGLDEHSKSFHPPASSFLGRHFETASSDTDGDIHVFCPDPHLPIPRPDLPEKVQGQDNGRGQVVFEERLCVGTRTQWEQGRVERGNHGDRVERNAYIASCDSECRSVRELFFGETVRVPTMSEAYFPLSVLVLIVTRFSLGAKALEQNGCRRGGRRAQRGATRKCEGRHV